MGKGSRPLRKLTSRPIEVALPAILLPALKTIESERGLGNELLVTVELVAPVMVPTTSGTVEITGLSGKLRPAPAGPMVVRLAPRSSPGNMAWQSGGVVCPTGSGACTLDDDCVHAQFWTLACQHDEVQKGLQDIAKDLSFHQPDPSRFVIREADGLGARKFSLLMRVTEGLAVGADRIGTSACLLVDGGCVPHPRSRCELAALATLPAGRSLRPLADAAALAQYRSASAGQDGARAVLSTLPGGWEFVAEGSELVFLRTPSEVGGTSLRLPLGDLHGNLLRHSSLSLRHTVDVVRMLVTDLAAAR